jgi:hypothetical protein
MLKSTVMAILIAASSATSVLPSGALTAKASGEQAQTDERDKRVVRQRPVYYESAHCRDARRQIAVYSRALSRLGVASSGNQHKVALYRQFRQTERDSLDKNCRPFAQTAHADLHEVNR